MGWDYAEVHLKYTIPPAIALAALYRPLLTRLDVYKIIFHITIAVAATIPWDSWLIRHRIWSYPDYAVVGPTLLDIPAEELFFFVIQTFNTALIYLLLNKATFHPIYLRVEKNNGAPKGKLAGQVVLILAIVHSFFTIRSGGTGMYMALILIWAGPVILMLWSLAYQFLVGLPLSNTLLPIVIPTVYLWVVDTFALRRGTWVIEEGTKYGFEIWRGLEIEEAVFFLITNTMIVFGHVAFDKSLAVLHTFPDRFPEHHGGMPSPLILAKTILYPEDQYDADTIAGLIDAVNRLRRKSRSFYLASGAFDGRLRIDLVRLYSFCRAADDLVDEASSTEEARKWIGKLYNFLDQSYSAREKATIASQVSDYVKAEFPAQVHFALLQLPTEYLPKQPLVDLLKGFETDLLFDAAEKQFPIETVEDLDLYAVRVAGTVAELCNHLILYHSTASVSKDVRERVLQSGVEMGIALQYVNIARDIKTDAGINRVYIPSTWLKDEGLTAQDIVQQPTGPTAEKLRGRLLDRAFAKYREAREAIEELPAEGRAPIRVAVESYMEIGRVLRQPNYTVKAGRATVPKLRRIRVAWMALSRK